MSRASIHHPLHPLSKDQQMKRISHKPAMLKRRLLSERIPPNKLFCHWF